MRRRSRGIMVTGRLLGATRRSAVLTLHRQFRVMKMQYNVASGHATVLDSISDFSPGSLS